MPNWKTSQRAQNKRFGVPQLMDIHTESSVINKAKIFGGKEEDGVSVGVVGWGRTLQNAVFCT